MKVLEWDSVIYFSMATAAAVSRAATTVTAIDATSSALAIRLHHDTARTTLGVMAAWADWCNGFFVLLFFHHGMKHCYTHERHVQLSQDSSVLL